MGKLTRVLIVLCLLLSIAALVLGHSLFAKREVLKGRAQKLQTAVIQLGALIPRYAQRPRPARILHVLGFLFERAGKGRPADDAAA